MMIKVEALHKRFHTNKVLQGINMEIKEGDTVAIIGPSGSGKSTLLRCLNGIEKPDKGVLQIEDTAYNLAALDKHDLAEVRRKSAMVFQNHNLFANKTVIENVTLALRIVKKMSKDEANQIAMKWLDRVGLLAKKDVYPLTLSGGERQRVSIARALSLKPKILLYDEPTSSLDPELVDEVLSVIKDVAKERVTSLIVTHEMRFARDVADYVVFIEDGVIVEQGIPEAIFQYPTKERTKQFLKSFFEERKNID